MFFTLQKPHTGFVFQIFFLQINVNGFLKEAVYNAAYINNCT